MERRRGEKGKYWAYRRKERREKRKIGLKEEEREGVIRKENVKGRKVRSVEEKEGIIERLQKKSLRGERM